MPKKRTSSICRLRKSADAMAADLVDMKATTGKQRAAKRQVAKHLSAILKATKGCAKPKRKLVGRDVRYNLPGMF